MYFSYSFQGGHSVGAFQIRSRLLSEPYFPQLTCVTRGETHLVSCCYHPRRPSGPSGQACRCRVTRITHYFIGDRCTNDNSKRHTRLPIGVAPARSSRDESYFGYYPFHYYVPIRRNTPAGSRLAATLPPIYLHRIRPTMGRMQLTSSTMGDTK